MDNIDAKILNSLTNFCSYQERSEYEVVLYFQKILKKKNTSDTTVNKHTSGHQLEKYTHILKKENFLNQHRFITAYINGKINIKAWGEKKILFGLQKHNISIDNIKEYYEAKKYTDNLKSLAIKKWKLLEKKSDAHTRQKIINFLSSRGYHLSEIIETIHHI